MITAIKTIYGFNLIMYLGLAIWTSYDKPGAATDFSLLVFIAIFIYTLYVFLQVHFKET